MTRVYLAVGHGEKPSGVHDPGAAGAGWTEQDAGDIIVAEAATVLRAAGVTVKDEANRDDPNFPGTARDANAWDADYVISIHHDWIKAPEGSFGHWYSPAGKDLADDIYTAIGDAGFPLRPSWHKRRTDLSLLKSTRAPTALIEVGRIGQDELDTPAELRAMGRAVAAGIARHLNITLEDDVDQDTLRRIIREEIDAALGGRDVATDLRRIRISQRAIGIAVGAPVDHQGPDDGSTVIA